MKPTGSQLILISLMSVLVFSLGCTASKSASFSEEKRAVSATSQKFAASNTQKNQASKPKKSAKTPEDQLLSTMRVSLMKSHEVFSEVWAHIWADRMQRPMSVFSEVGRLVAGHMDPTTGHYQLRSERCKEALPRSSEIVLERDKTGIRSANVYRYDCNKAGATRTDLAHVQFSREGSKVRAVWQFQNENLPRGAGSSMAFLREKTRCTMILDERDRLEKLDCQTVGQNRDSEIHMRFDRMVYTRGSDQMLLVEGKKFKNLTTPYCDEPKFCTQVKVPLVGKIEIFDDVVSQEAKELQARKAREEEHKEAQAALEKRVLEQKKMLETDAKNQKLKAQRMQLQMEGTSAMGTVEAPPGLEQAMGQAQQNPNHDLNRAARGTPGEPFADQSGQIAPASAQYAPGEIIGDPNSGDALYDAPQSVDEDPAAIMAEQPADSNTGVYEFNHQNSNQNSPEVGRQATDGMIR